MRANATSFEEGRPSPSIGEHPGLTLRKLAEIVARSRPCLPRVDARSRRGRDFPGYRLRYRIRPLDADPIGIPQPRLRHERLDRPKGGCLQVLREGNPSSSTLFLDMLPRLSISGELSGPCDHLRQGVDGVAASDASKSILTFIGVKQELEDLSSET